MHLAAPEGKYNLYSERHAGLQYFNSGRATKITFSDPLKSEENYHVLFNVSDYLHICNYSQTGKPPRRSISFAGDSAGAAHIPTCHDFFPSTDGYDIVIGFGTGDVALVSLQAQIQAGATSSKPIQMLQYGPEGPVDSSKCTAVAFIPGSEGTVFAAAHWSGTVIIHIKGKEATSSKSTFAIKALSSSPQRGPATPLYVSNEGLYAMAVSPDGKHLATASKDGVTRVFELSTAQLCGGFKSYYGGVQCVAWSPDGCYLAAGGEDDLVSIYGLAEKGLVAWGEGHNSWVMQVAFDPWLCQKDDRRRDSRRASMELHPLGRETTYRLGSVGQDCQLLLWDFVIPDDFAGTNATALHQSSYSTQTSSTPTSATSHISTSSSSFDPPTGASHRRRHSHGTPTHGHKVSNGSLNFNNQDLIAPSVPHAHMVLTAPVSQQRVHTEPLSDLLFSQYALYTADACGQLRCWQRPPPPAPVQARAPEDLQVRGQSVAAQRAKQQQQSQQPQQQQPDQQQHQQSQAQQAQHQYGQDSQDPTEQAASAVKRHGTQGKVAVGAEATNDTSNRVEQEPYSEASKSS